MAGGKLLWVLEHLGEEPVGDLLLSRGGMCWFGGFVGGVLAGFAVMRVAFGLSVAHFMSLAAMGVGVGMLVVLHGVRRDADSHRNLS